MSLLRALAIIIVAFGVTIIGAIVTFVLYALYTATREVVTTSCPRCNHVANAHEAFGCTRGSCLCPYSAQWVKDNR